MTMTGKTLVLRHDPESGCGGCPLLATEPGYDPPDWRCAATHSLVNPYVPAPEECPLRTGAVVVQAP